MPQEMISLSNLKGSEGARKQRVRRGRGTGSGLGKTAGRGGKGQTARTGKGRPMGFEGGQMPLYRRLPKFGFTSPFKRQFDVVNLFALETKFEAGATVGLAQLVEKGLIRSENSFVKILGEGTLSKKLTVYAHRFSKSALQKIAQAGGQTEQLKLPGEASEEAEETKLGSG